MGYVPHTRMLGCEPIEEKHFVAVVVHLFSTSSYFDKVIGTSRSEVLCMKRTERIYLGDAVEKLCTRLIGAACNVSTTSPPTTSRFQRDVETPLDAEGPDSLSLGPNCFALPVTFEDSWNLLPT